MEDIKIVPGERLTIVTETHVVTCTVESVRKRNGDSNLSATPTAPDDQAPTDAPATSPKADIGPATVVTTETTAVHTRGQ